MFLLVAAATLVAHWPVLNAQAISFDDQLYLTENDLIPNPSRTAVVRVFTEILNPTVAGYYEPLSMLSMMWDSTRGGCTENLRPFHATSLALHMANAVLTAGLIQLLFGNIWVAGAVGLIFGVHPVMVEPIALMSQRKTVLTTFFALGCLVFYVSHARRNSLLLFTGSLSCFLMALLSKPTSTPLPLVLLLMDCWPLKRMTARNLLEKIPFFLIAGIFGLITVMSTARTAGITMAGSQTYPVSGIILKIGYLNVFYLLKLLWPVNLCLVYTLPEPMSVANPRVVVAFLGTALLAAAAVWSLRWTRAILTGWLMFFLTIFPTMGPIRYTWVAAADKYLYLPVFGLLLVLGWGLTHLLTPERRLPIRAGTHMLLILCILTTSAQTRRYLGHWQATIPFYEYMLTLAPDAPQLHYDLGVTLANRGDTRAAIDRYNQAIALRPAYPEAHANLAVLLIAQQRIDEAETHLKTALNERVKYPEAMVNMGVIAVRRGNLEEALGWYRKALDIRPGYVDAMINIGVAFQRQGKLDEALEQYRVVLERRPNSPEARNNRGIILALRGDLDGAIAEHQHAVELKPAYPEAHYQLGLALARKGQQSMAMEHYQRAIQLRPDYAEAHNSLGGLLTVHGRTDEAIAHFERALSLQPDFPEAHNNLGSVLAGRGDYDKAIMHFAAAIKSKPDFVTAQINLGNAHRRAGRLAEAEAAHRLAIRMAPANADTRFQLANDLAAQGRTVDAAEAYREAIRLNPNHAEARTRLDALSSQPASSP